MRLRAALLALCCFATAHAETRPHHVGKVQATMADAHPSELWFDGARVPADKKSLAYSLTYRASDRTLTAEEVNAAHARLKERLTGQLGVTLRE